MSPTTKNRLLGFIALVIICVALVVLWQMKRTEQPSMVVATPGAPPPEAETPRRTLDNDLKSVEGAVPEVNRSGAEWQRALAAISEADLKSREPRQTRRIMTFFVQQRLEELGLEWSGSEKLRELLEKRFLFESDFRARLKAEGVPRKGDEFERRLLQGKADLDAQIQSIVGPDRLKAITVEEHRVRVPTYALEMVGEAARQGVPLSISQRAAMNEVLARLDASGLSSGSDDPADPSLGANLYDLKAYAALEGVLTGKQLQIFQDIRYEYHLYLEAKQLAERRLHGLETPK